MAMRIDNISGLVLVNGNRVTQAMDLADGDCVETGAGGSACIYSDGVLAATVSGPNSSLQSYTPPTLGLSQGYYRYSYRWLLKTPGGSVGIRA